MTELLRLTRDDGALRQVLCIDLEHDRAILSELCEPSEPDAGPGARQVIAIEDRDTAERLRDALALALPRLPQARDARQCVLRLVA